MFAWLLSFPERTKEPVKVLGLSWRRSHRIAALLRLCSGLFQLVLGETGLNRTQLWLEWWSSRTRVLEFIWQDRGASDGFNGSAVLC